jgi:RHS repeat-associated protein
MQMTSEVKGADVVIPPSNRGADLYGPGGQLLESYRAWNDLADYVYFGGRLLYTLSGDTALTRIDSDRLGSTRVTKTIQHFGGGSTTRNYYPFGEEIGTPSANNTYKFASIYRDSSTGLDYAINRYYASGMGRFLSPDRKRRSANLRIPGSWNRHIYGSNDPINRRDPLGLDDYLDDGDDDDEPFGYDDGGIEEELPTFRVTVVSTPLPPDPEEPPPGDEPGDEPGGGGDGGDGGGDGGGGGCGGGGDGGGGGGPRMALCDCGLSFGTFRVLYCGYTCVCSDGKTRLAGFRCGFGDKHAYKLCPAFVMGEVPWGQELAPMVFNRDYCNGQE